ncbi:PIG-L deacetylase family protein [Longimicrobium terrae]|uniref:LmbE family N-acetylglucosaminyl deacetylase n=1 Tax=Longimicrobium terrae TaxID=1639882 RepID=A0A841GYD2_9BACT|nr:PIG-L deacetylase family protein [Longimicrobium terrae]MBB4636333.1 LmbE family N-acetylglucosaminyl deacetylase [Longimicrobium terrae]MBB6070729.1 LmbE family N-acetylglucosaminyl deacetylase [Longimicrobium terrae]NNC29708.1 PIG-L family deacetylase [Longimicrobium terrae]
MPDSANPFLRWLADGGPAPRLLVAFAHPDDETIGAGGVLRRLGDARLVCVTDGAPHRREWWGDPSLNSREEYAAVRRRELRAALAVVGIGAERVCGFGVADQEASAHLAHIARRMAGEIAAAQPDAVLAPAYEGGHPDHDAVAFAVHAACALLAAEGRRCPAIVEYPLYHAEEERMVVGSWLPGAEAGAVTVRLSDEEQAAKREMIACHASQSATLAQFPVDAERFRPAPAYDFRQPPHAGQLNYEVFGWADGAAWRSRAADALRELGIGPADGANGFGALIGVPA